LKRNKIFKITYPIVLVVFTVYVLLDTFVIPHTYDTADAADLQSSDTGLYAENSVDDEGLTDEVAELDNGNSDDDEESSDGRDSDSGSGRPSRKRNRKSSRRSDDESSGSDSDSDGSDGADLKNEAGTDAYDQDTDVDTDAGDIADEDEVLSDNSNEVITASGISAASDAGIEVTTYDYLDTKVYVADITLSDASELKTALANNTYGKNVKDTTSNIAMANNATLAINGDFYGARESGYVIRNGVLYRNTPVSGNEDLVIYEDGSFEIINESEISAEQLLENGAVNVFSFGPALVEDYETSVEEGDEVGKAMASNPRTAIGYYDDLHYVFVVSDGRTSQSEGLSLSELAEFMIKLGVKSAYNLDGGGSSTMYYNGEVINNPTTNGKSIKERSVSDIIYIS